MGPALACGALYRRRFARRSCVRQKEVLLAEENSAMGCGVDWGDISLWFGVCRFSPGELPPCLPVESGFSSFPRLACCVLKRCSQVYSGASAIFCRRTRTHYA